MEDVWTMEITTPAPANVWDDAIRTARARFTHIDPERLAAFISAQPDVHGPVSIEDFDTLTDGSGMSNGIAFFTAVIDRGEGPRRESLVLRYAPGVSLLQQKSFEDEFLTMKAVHAAGLTVPAVMWLDADGEGIGAPGFVMERVVGEIPASAMYSRGPFAKLSNEDRHRMMLEPAGFHGRLRKAAIGADRVPHLLKRGEGATPLERELSWWLKEAQLITEPDDPRFLRVKSVHDWLLANQPPVREATLIHGDAQHCNTIFRDGVPAGVLDWELAHLGYAETDIVMMVLTTEILKLTDIVVDDTPTEEEYIARYEAESGEKVEHWAYFKLCMAYRYLVGQIFAANALPNPEEMWAIVDEIVAENLAEAKAASASSQQA